MGEKLSIENEALSEITAMKDLVALLKPLKPWQRDRVLDWAQKFFEQDEYEEDVGQEDEP